MDKMTIFIDRMTRKVPKKPGREAGRAKASFCQFLFDRKDLMSFGIQCLGFGHVSGRWRMKELIRRRTLYHYALIFIERGEGFFQTAHVPYTRIRAGEGLLLLPNEEHSYKCDPKHPWQEYFITFDGRAVRQAHQDKLLSEQQVLLRPRDRRHVKKLFESCFKEGMSASPAAQKRLPGIFHQILDEMLPEHADFVDHGPADVVEVVRKGILSNPDKSLDLQMVARQHGVSYSSLRQRFRQVCGTSIHQYHNKARVNLACKLLSEGHSVKETSALVGIDDPYYFSRLFKKITNSSPTDFTRKLEP